MSIKKKTFALAIALGILASGTTTALAADIKDPSTAKPITKVQKYKSEFDTNPWLTKVGEFLYIESDKAKKDPQGAAKALNETANVKSATTSYNYDYSNPNKAYEDVVLVWNWYNGGLYSKTNIVVDASPSWGSYVDGYYKQNDTATNDPVPTSHFLQPTLEVNGFNISVSYPWGGSAELQNSTIIWPTSEARNVRTAIYDYPKYEVHYTAAYGLKEIDKGSIVFGGNIKGMGSQVDISF